LGVFINSACNIDSSLYKASLLCASEHRSAVADRIGVHIIRHVC